MKIKWKKICRYGTLTVYMLAFTFSSSFLAYAGRFHETKNGTYYIEDDGGIVVNKWKEIDGKMYFFNGNGYLIEDPAQQFQDLQFEQGEFPLAHLREEFVVDSRGCLTWRWETDYLEEKYPGSDNRMVDWSNEKKISLPESLTDGKIEWTQHTETKEIMMKHAIEVNDVSCFYYPKGEDMLAIAKLAGVKLTGYQHRENDERVLALEKEIKSFLDSFQWENSSDFEKAVKVSERIMKADYFDDTTTALNDFGQEYSVFGDSGYSYGCLVIGKATCSGYSSASSLLSICIDLPHAIIARIDLNHAYPAYFINGIWLSHEPTRKENNFELFDWQDDVDSGLNYGIVAEHSIRTGSELPKDVKSAFPDSFGYTSIYSWNRIQNNSAGDQGIFFSYINKIHE